MGSAILLPEGNGAIFGIHGIHDCQGFYMITQITNHATADLETLLNHDAAALYDGTGRFGNGDQALQGTAVCQEIVDDQDMLPFMEELLGHNDLILILVGKGFHLGHKHLAVQVDGFGLLGEDHGYTKFLGNKRGDADTGGLNGHDLGNGLVTEAAFEFTADFLHQRDIHLMVQKAVHFQNIAGFDDTIFYNSFFQKIHCGYLPVEYPYYSMFFA